MNSLDSERFKRVAEINSYEKRLDRIIAFDLFGNLREATINEDLVVSYRLGHYRRLGGNEVGCLLSANDTAARGGHRFFRNALASASSGRSVSRLMANFSSLA